MSTVGSQEAWVLALTLEVVAMGHGACLSVLSLLLSVRWGWGGAVVPKMAAY